MSKTPEFIEFAAIQIFAAMVGDPRRGGKSFEEDAQEAWRVAKVLYDAKPRETGEETNEDDDEDDQPCMWFDFVIDDLGTYGVYRDGLFVLEASSKCMDANYRNHLIKALNLPSETCIAFTRCFVPVVVGSWPKLYDEAKKIGHAGPY